MKTTLNKIWEHGPCTDGREKLLKYLGKSGPDDEPLPILIGLESNGLDDTLWALRAVEKCDREIRLYACKCACRVLHIFEAAYPDDLRPRQAIETAALYAEGLATEEERSAAWATARDAAWAAAGDAAWAAAWAAARDATRAAAGAAAWAAAGATARDAAWAAAGDAAWAAARDAAWAEREYQKKEFIKMCKMGKNYEI